MQCRKALIFLMIISLSFALPRRFCGDDLTNLLSNFCFKYNTPAPRERRQVAKECCSNLCSIRNLVSNYCESFDREAVDKYVEELKKSKECDEEENVDRASEGTNEDI